MSKNEFLFNRELIAFYVRTEIEIDMSAKVKEFGI